DAQEPQGRLEARPAGRRGTGRLAAREARAEEEHGLSEARERARRSAREAARRRAQLQGAEGRHAAGDRAPGTRRRRSLEGDQRAQPGPLAQQALGGPGLAPAGRGARTGTLRAGRRRRPGLQQAARPMSLAMRWMLILGCLMLAVLE